MWIRAEVAVLTLAPEITRNEIVSTTRPESTEIEMAAPCASALEKCVAMWISALEMSN